MPEIFQIIFRKFSVPFDFEPEFSVILVEWNALYCENSFANCYFGLIESEPCILFEVVFYLVEAKLVLARYLGGASTEAETKD